MNDVARRLFAACVLAASIGLIAAASPQPTLPTVLAEIRRLDEASTLGVVSWASYPKPAPPDVVLSPLDQVEVDILALAPADRTALMDWLRTGERTALYARGLDDEDIGACIPLVESPRCSAHAGAQAMSSSPPGAAAVGSASLPAGEANPRMVFLRWESGPQSGAASGVRITGGFAAVRAADGDEVHCISYVNATSRAIAAVTFTYRLLSASGSVLAAGSDIAAVAVAPGAANNAPADWQSYRTADDHPTPSCWHHAGLVATAAAPTAAIAAISVSAVTFDDGSHWPP